MAFKLFLLVRLEFFTAGKYANSIVQGLGGQPLLVGGLGHEGHGVHGGVGDVLHVHRDVPLPDPQGLVIRG